MPEGENTSRLAARQAVLVRNADWMRDYMKSFYNEDEEIQHAMLMKEAHTGRVRAIIRDLAVHLGGQSHVEDEGVFRAVLEVDLDAFADYEKNGQPVDVTEYEAWHQELFSDADQIAIVPKLISNEMILAATS